MIGIIVEVGDFDAEIWLAIIELMNSNYMKKRNAVKTI